MAAMGRCLAAILATATIGVLPLGAQTLLPKATVQHATFAASSSAASVTGGSALTLWADVTPNRSIHIYAQGAKEFTPVSLVLTPNTAIAPGKPVYPKADIVATPGVAEPVPAYTQRFRIAVPVTVKATARAGDVLTVGGAVTYQACDDRVCYPVTSAPVTWTLQVK
jgi:hypothetical protein